ncbi:MAG: NAD(P)/FAD-dependent oxidoreductase [Bacteroidota bacterium]|nr:NAD(P)/FAD-dependent oxidoreductase [Bacteroidota bacterium]
MTKAFDVLIIGGGAAGFFSAINIAEKNKGLKIGIVERNKEVLSKVRISGGGRCNITHACYDVSELITYYPRGFKELRGVFNVFSPKNTFEWFDRHRVALKVESDNRVFPTSDSSQTIIGCFLQYAHKYGIEIFTSVAVRSIKDDSGIWRVETSTDSYVASKIVLATGSNTKVWDMLSELGHTIIEPVPSLFTFNCKDTLIKNLMGVSTTVKIKIADSKYAEQGSLLITHWGISGPAVLRLSAWAARDLHQKSYNFTVEINWLNDIGMESCVEQLKRTKEESAKKLVRNQKAFDIPSRLWEHFVEQVGVPAQTKWADLKKTDSTALVKMLTASRLQIVGKSTFKDEFVTAGGIDLKEVNFKTMESKRFDNLYFAGEILNIDAVTGGFNFQNAWSTAYVLAQSICKAE